MVIVYAVVGQIPSTTDKERYELCWNPRGQHAAGNHTLHSKEHSANQHDNVKYTRAIQGHSGHAILANILSQSLLPKVRGQHQTVALGGFNHERRRQGVYFTSVHPLEKNSASTYETYKHMKPDHDAIYVFDMKQPQDMNFEFYQTLKGCVTCVNAIPAKCLVKIIHVIDKPDTYN